MKLTATHSSRVGLLALLVCLATCGRDPSLAETVEYIGNLTYVDDVIARSDRFKVDQANPCVIVYASSSEFGERHVTLNFSTINPESIDRPDKEYPSRESVIEMRTTNAKPLILVSGWSRVNNGEPERREGLVISLKDKRDKPAVVKALRSATLACGGRADAF